MASHVDPSQLGLYEILGVSVKATNKEIHNAYKKKAREYHPDKTGTDKSEEYMKRLNKAKETLLSEKREEYDEKMENEEGEGNFDPAGFLLEGQRLSLIFLQYFKKYKILFEGGFIQNIQNFQTLLQNELHKETKAPPALPFAEHTPRKSCKPRAATVIQPQTSPLDEVIDVTSNALADSELNTLVEKQHRQLQRILEMTKESGMRSSLPPRDNLTPILDFSGVPDTSLQFLHSLFVESDEASVLERDRMLSNLSNFVPYVNVEQCSDVIPPKICGNCNRKFYFLNKPNQTCYHCKLQFCKSCPIKQIGTIPRIKCSETLCSKCLQLMSQLDAEDWTKSSVDLIKVGTTGSIKAAMGCLTIALCLSDSETKPIIRVAQGFFHNGLPELAVPFVSTVLQNSKADSRDILGMYVLGAQIFKTMADQTTSNQELQWEFLLAAKDCCNLALQEVSGMDSSVEVPSLTSVNRDITASLHLLREQQEQMHEREVQLQCVQFETLWLRRDYENLLTQFLTDDEARASEMNTLSFLPRLESQDVLVLEHFLAPKEGFLDKMCPDDRCAILFFRGILKIRKGRISEGLIDVEEAAYGSHHHVWLKEAVANVLIGLLLDDPATLFPPESFSKLSTGRHLLGTDILEDRFESLFPKKHEITPPFSRNWPELTVTGLNIKGHLKFEKAVLTQVNKGAWSEWDVAMAYIDYIPACGHSAELALCFLNAAMWLLKHLMNSLSSPTSKRVQQSEVYATKGLIVDCLQNSLTIAYLHLHPGMQLYISRLCLGTLLEAMQHATKYATQTDTDLATNLLYLMMYTCRFNPIWQFPSAPLSEAVLVNIKTGRFHQNFLLDLQQVDQKRWPMTRPELLYQLYENDLRYICKLDDSDGIRSQAMEEMLNEKGWTWNDVTNLMSSPLSPRDQDGFLIQQPFLGVSLEFAELKGFSFILDSDNPSIEIITVPASKSRGRPGLFSMEDVQTVLQLDVSDLIFFSLDPPNDKQRFHPFQQFCYGDEKLHKTPWLHTLFETDYLLKSFSVGVEVSAKPPFNQRPCEKGLTKNLPPHLQEAIKPVSKRGSTTSNIHRFWIQAGELVYSQKQVGSKLTVHLGNLKMSVRSHPLLPGPDGKLEDTEDQEDPDSPEAKFAANLTSHYNELGLHFPMFARLRELAKLQVLGIILRSVMEDLREKANGVGVEVPRRLLTEMQQDARQNQQRQVQEVIRNLNQEIGVWPAAEDYTEVSSLVQTIISQLPYHIQSQASDSDVRPHAEQMLRTKDSSVLSQVVDGLMQLCEQRLYRGSLESSVRQWLSSRSSTATSHLVDLICSSLPLPTNEDIKRQMIELHNQRYSAFKRKVNSVTSPLPKVISNPCKWVPAALLKEETTDTMSMCYGGVLLYVRLQSGNVTVSSHAYPVQVQRSGAKSAGQYQSNSSTFHAPKKRFKPADATESGGEGGRSIHPICTKRPSAAPSKPRTNNSPAKVIGSMFQPKSCSAARNTSTASSKPSPRSAPALVSTAVSGGAPNTNARNKIKITNKTTSKQNSKGGEREKGGGGGGGKGGGGGGGKGGGGGGDSGDEGGKKRKGQELSKEEFEWKLGEKLKEVKRDANEIYTNNKKGLGCREYYFMYLKEGDTEMHALSKDTAKHGQAAFKVYKITRKTLTFSYSVDVNLEPMYDKHESREGEVIQRSTLSRKK